MAFMLDAKMILFEGNVLSLNKEDNNVFHKSIVKRHESIDTAHESLATLLKGFANHHKTNCIRRGSVSIGARSVCLCSMTSFLISASVANNAQHQTICATKGETIMAAPNTEATLKTARNVLAGISKFSAPLTGEVTADALQARVTSLQGLVDNIQGLKKQLVDLQNERDRIATDVAGMVKRARVQVRAQFGDDASEIELVGLKRASERKRPRPRAGAGA